MPRARATRDLLQESRPLRSRVDLLCRWNRPVQDVRGGFNVRGGSENVVLQNSEHRLPRRLRCRLNILNVWERPLHTVPHVRRGQVLHRSVHYDNHLGVRKPRHVLCRFSERRRGRLHGGLHHGHRKCGHLRGVRRRKIYLLW